MRHILLRFNYAVEIGARLAYLGHYRRTKDPIVNEIAWDELKHQNELWNIMSHYQIIPFFLFDFVFMVIGGSVYLACQVSPRFMLNWVAKTLEFFAFVSYTKLAKLYPKFEMEFLEMARTEKRHGEYFDGKL